MDWVRADTRYFQNLDQWRWTWSSATTIVGTPIGPDGTAVVVMDSGDHQRLVTFSGAVTIAITTAGVNGLHNDHGEAANTGYDVYLCAKAGAVGGFLVPDGTAINAAKMASLGDGSYHWWSKVKAFWISNNNASNLRAFRPIGPRAFQYIDAATDASMLNPGGATVATALTFTDKAAGTGPLIPSAGTKRVVLDAIGSNSTAANRNAYIYSDSGATQVEVVASGSCGTAANGARTTTRPVILTMDNLAVATAYYYKWDGAVGVGEGLYLRVLAVEM